MIYWPVWIILCVNLLRRQVLTFVRVFGGSTSKEPEIHMNRKPYEAIPKTLTDTVK